MGLFGFLGEITQAVVKSALIPVTIVKDTVDVVVGNEPQSTSENIESIGDNLENAVDKLIDE